MEMEKKRNQCEAVKDSASSAFDVSIAPKFKRRKVSGIRDFPLRCEPLGAQTALEESKILGSVVGTAGDLSGKRDSAVDLEDDSDEPFEIDDWYPQNSADSETEGFFNNLESMVGANVDSDSEEVAELPKVLDGTNFIDALKISEPERAVLIDSVKSIVRLEVKNALEHECIGLIDSIESIVRSEVKNVLEDQVRAQRTNGLSLKLTAGASPEVHIPRRRVSAIRCFPPGCGRHAASEKGCLEAKASSENKVLDHQKSDGVAVGSIGNFLGKKDSVPNSEDDFVEPFDIDTGSQQKSAHSEIRDLSSGLEPLVEKVVNFYQEEVAESDVESPKALDDARFGLMDSITKSICVVEDEDRAQQMRNIETRSANLAKIFPPRRTVSAIRSFPPGCGRHAADLSKKDCPKALASSEEIQFSKCSKIGPENIDTKEKCAESICTNSLSQSDLKSDKIVRKHDEVVGGSEGKQQGCLTDMENRAISLSGEQTIQLQVELPNCLEHPERRVVVQALMAGPRCPWRRDKRAIKSSSTTGKGNGKNRRALFLTTKGLWRAQMIYKRKLKGEKNKSVELLAV